MTEGKASFTANRSTCETWYTVFGDLEDLSKTPLFIVHGASQAGHEYMIGLKDLREPVILYDQLGCGQSSRLTDKIDDESFWSVELFCSELSNLISHLGVANRPIDVLGHSWGGMVAATWASDNSRAKNLRRLVLYSTLASTEGQIRSLEKSRKLLPQDEQEAIERGLRNQDFSATDFKDGVNSFYQKYIALASQLPCDEAKPASASIDMAEVHKVLWGPNILEPEGLLRDWTIIPHLHQIKAPTLLVRGSAEYLQEDAMQPFFDRIPKVRWITIDNAAHFAHLEQREKFLDQVGRFLDN